MKKLLLASFLVGALTPSESSSKTVTIAVIDTGIDRNIPHLCKFGHKSFTEGKPLEDEHGHGTQMAGLINRQIKGGNYCMVSIKWWNPKATDAENVESMRKAIEYANNIKAKFINISGGGDSPNDAEKLAVLKALKRGAIIVTSAGNSSKNLDSNCDYFPACYDSRIIVVGNNEKSGNRQPMSNYGNYVNRWEVGTMVESDYPGGKKAIGTGTSQSAAIATGKLVRSMLSK